MEKNTVIDIKDVNKEFTNGNSPLMIFENVNFKVKQGEKVAIVGASGSGKSTLLSLLAGLDKPTLGDIYVKGRMINRLSYDELSDYRNSEVSIIFQSFELIAPFNSFENISAPLDIRGGIGASRISEITNTLLQDVGLTERAESFPETLSGGERQRVAICRALASDADIILADEPTGSLDAKTGRVILDLLINEVGKRKKTLIIITHDMNIAEKMDRIVELRDRKLHEIKRESESA